MFVLQQFPCAPSPTIELNNNNVQMGGNCSRIEKHQRMDLSHSIVSDFTTPKNELQCGERG
jgi:hypothetical protein